ncbi:signal peptide peptidase SppA [Marispirochaeta sp.]|jgi:protease IV|uniref:signal peptide peptidase SppA n=1 Tax=Marispirochaeta sp. TaxID=2038653 RepID=UPI0029C610E8|nr:signal peptide peptidase SppA [Marispirochaeta sp.]
MKKRYLSLYILISLSTLLFSLDYPGTATGDDFLSLRVNPASMAFGNAGGFALIHPYLLDGDEGERPDLFNEYSLQLAFTNLGYYFDKQDTDYTHNLLAAFPLFPNFYFGLQGSWQNSELDDSDATIGFLARPSDFLSLAATGEKLFTSDAAGVAGVGVRPLFFTENNPSLLTLGIDVPWDGSINSPVLHASSEPVDTLPGFAFSLAYNMETDRFTAGLSYSVGTIRSGTLIDNKTRGAAYVHLGTRKYSSPRVPMTDPYIRFNPGPEITEESAPGFFFFDPPSPTLFQVLEELRRLEKDPAVKGIVIERQNFRTSWAGYLELISALNRFRESGKKVVYYYENISLWNYVLAASTGDAIYLNRLGRVDLTGLGGTRLYFGGLLNSFGVKVHNIRSHPFKNGANFVSEPGITAEEREMLETFYSDVLEEVLALIRSGRGDKLSGDLEEIVAAGPYLISGDALKAGLVDGVIYHDQLAGKLEDFHQHPVISNGDFTKSFRRDWSDPFANQIALIYAVGNIIPGKGVPGSTIGSETLGASIRAARENPFVKALLIRVDSGGGSSLASDVIAREVQLTVEAGKPVIVSMGGAAASGGYYISAYADTIVASPLSVTGSIGVYVALPEFAGLLEKYEIGTAQLGTSDNASFANPLRRLGTGEREKLSALVDHTYDLFVETVAQGRGMDTAEVDAVAQGRVWTGRQALDRGLVDQLGGFQDALDTAAEAAGIRGQYMLVDYSNRDIPLSLRMAESFKSPLEGLFIPEILLKQDGPLYMMPFNPTD